MSDARIVKMIFRPARQKAQEYRVVFRAFLTQPGRKSASKTGIKI